MCYKDSTFVFLTLVLVQVYTEAVSPTGCQLISGFNTAGSCNFSSNTCGYILSGHWYYKNSGYNPVSHFNSNGHDASNHFLEIHWNKWPHHGEDTLTSPQLAPGIYCFEFWYNMMGSAISLNISTTTGQVLASNLTDPGHHTWKRKAVTIQDKHNFKIVFKAIRPTLFSESEQTLGIDDITIRKAVLPSTTNPTTTSTAEPALTMVIPQKPISGLGSCSFRSINDTCDYTLEVRWMVHHGPYKLHGVHTVILGGHADEYFALFDPHITAEMMNITEKTNQTYDMTSPCLPPGTYNLSFWYIMPSGLSYLSVLTKSYGLLSESWIHSGRQSSWAEQSLMITKRQPFQIIFRSYRGRSSGMFVGVDSISVVADEESVSNSTEPVRCFVTTKVTPSTASTTTATTTSTTTTPTTTISTTTTPPITSTTTTPTTTSTTKTSTTTTPTTTSTTTTPTITSTSTTPTTSSTTTTPTITSTTTTPTTTSTTSTPTTTSTTTTPTITSTTTTPTITSTTTTSTTTTPTTTLTTTTPTITSTSTTPTTSSTTTTPTITSTTTTSTTISTTTTPTTISTTTTPTITSTTTTPTKTPTITSTTSTNTATPTNTLTSVSELRLEDAIHPGCSSMGWNITVDMDILKHLYPGVSSASIFFGDNTCHGTEKDSFLMFQQGLRQCLTDERIDDTRLIYENDIIYALYDPINPFIIRQHKWTYTVECDVSRDEATSTHVHHDVESHHASVTSHYSVNMTFYRDPNFNQEIPGKPLHVNVGDDLYVKVFTTTTDWTVKMRVHTCYTKPDDKAPDHMKYFIIQDGCETDANTHIISQSTHETRFVFQDFEYSTNHEGLNIYCDATFCETKDYTQHCLQTCNPNSASLVGK